MSILHRIPCALLSLALSGPVALGQSDDFVLVRHSKPVEVIRLIAINDQQLEYFDKGGSKPYAAVPLDDCIALLNPRATPQSRTKGLLILADGQRLPGETQAGAKPQGDALAWNHPWLGRIDVPLTSVESILLSPDATAPHPGPKDVVLLANGDRQDGLIVSFGNSIAMEVERNGRPQIVEIPLNLVTAITMIAPKQQPIGRRIWFDEGTIIDVQSINVGDDGYVRLTGAALAGGSQTTKVGLSQIAAVLLDPRGMIPLATLPPSRVEGPATRFVLPKPHVLDPGAPLNLAKIEYHGPLVVRYALPADCQRFTAEAELPREARIWGDYELLIRSNDDEIFRGRLSAGTPTLTINAQLIGRELTIELLPAAYGPVQDRLILHRAMLLKGK